MHLLRVCYINQSGRQNVDIIRRFTGGGTVVADSSTMFCSMILHSGNGVPKYPREIMAWTSDVYAKAFAPVFGRDDHPVLIDREQLDDDMLALRQRSTTRGFTGLASGSSGRFHLEEHDYCFGERKIGGNAQTLTRGRFVHHTSFLTDMNPDLMSVLRVPRKRPTYRGTRGHLDFLTTATVEAGRQVHPSELASAVTRGLHMWFDDVVEASEEEAWAEAGLTPEEADAILDVPIASRPKVPFDQRLRTVRESLPSG